MDKQAYLNRRSDLLATITQLRAEVEALDTEYTKTHDLPTGAKVQLSWRDGNTDTVAVSGHKINARTGKITPLFRTIKRNGKPGETIAKVQRGYMAAVLDANAFPELATPNA